MGQLQSIYQPPREPLTACELSELTTSVHGISQSGESASDSWLLKINQESLSKNPTGKKYNIIFMKYFMDYDTLVKYFLDKRSNEYKENFIPMFTDLKTGKLPDEYRTLRYTIAESSNVSTTGLDYERKVYSLITQPIIQNLVSPFFVNTVSTSSSCSFSTLSKILENNGIPIRNLYRNIAYFLMGISNRPSINDSKEVSEQDLEERIDIASYSHNTGNFDKRHFEGLMKYIESVKDQLKFGFILNTAEPLGTLTLYGLISKYGTIYTDEKRTALSQWFIDVMFQISTVLYVMKCAGFNHNDLHGDNIWIEILDKPKRVDMVYRDTRYSISTRYMVKVYDYDFSSVSFLKPNAKAQNSYMSIPGEDNVKTTRYITQLEPILEFIVNYEKEKNPEGLNIPLGALFTISGKLTKNDGFMYLKFATNNRRITSSMSKESESKHIASIETIMDRLYEMNINKIADFDNPERVYIADPSIFNRNPPEDGDYTKAEFIKTHKLYKIRSEVAGMVRK